jgi:hypothetical protein
MAPRHKLRANSEESYVTLDVTSSKLSLILNHPIWLKEVYENKSEELGDKWCAQAAPSDYGITV